VNILLINPPGNFARAGSRWPHKTGEGMGYVPFPFWLSCAGSFLKARGFEVDIKDCVALGWDMSRLKSYIVQFAPELLVMETSAPSYKYDIETLNQIRNDKIKITAVGYHATALPKLHLDDGFNYVIKGEYELPLYGLARYLDGTEKTLPKKGVASVENPDVENGGLIENLDDIPFPAREFLPMEKYVDVFAFGKSIQVITSRGCPFKCCFCCEALLPGKPSVRFRSPENVCNEIEQLIVEYQPDEIYFDDSSFTVSKKHIIGICEQMQKRNLNISWSCMADAKVDPDILNIMAKAGCRALKLGVESADSEVLANIPKHVNLDDVRRTINECKKVGIKTHATFMFGLPGETKDKAAKTIDFALSLGTDTAQFSIATPYPGTRFYDIATKEGLLVSDGWENFGSDAVISYPDYTRQDITEMHHWAVARWQRNLVINKPGTVLHYFKTAYRRNGINGILDTAIEGCRQLLKGLKWI